MFVLTEARGSKSLFNGEKMSLLRSVIEIDKADRKNNEKRRTVKRAKKKHLLNIFKNDLNRIKISVFSQLKTLRNVFDIMSE